MKYPFFAPLSLRAFALSLSLLALVLLIPAVSACGGLFCQTSPVNQDMERIIFAVNDNATISAYVQINYTGQAPNFSWVVPVPDVPEVDVAEMSTFDELAALTDPMFIPPLMPECAQIERQQSQAMATDILMPTPTFFADVEVLSSGTAGPYAFDVVTSEDTNALIYWLRTNNYQVAPAMEPLIHVYSDEGMVFLAMKLQPDQGVQDIQPVKMTYPSERPMIPLRLTAVAANPNMTVQTWIFADAQAIPANWAYPTVDDADLRMDATTTTGTNYLALADATIDLYDGRAFITEYAQPAASLSELRPDDALLQQLAADYDYVTRVLGRISPEEMTVDPVFDFSAQLPDISNVHDLSNADAAVFWGCENRPIQLEYDEAVVPDGF